MCLWIRELFSPRSLLTSFVPPPICFYRLIYFVFSVYLTKVGVALIVGQSSLVSIDYPIPVYQPPVLDTSLHLTVTVDRRGQVCSVRSGVISRLNHAAKVNIGVVG